MQCERSFSSAQVGDGSRGEIQGGSGDAPILKSRCFFLALTLENFGYGANAAPGLPEVGCFYLRRPRLTVDNLGT